MTNEKQTTDSTNQCPNGCGEMACATGQISDNEGRTYWNVFIPYCPVCMYYEEAEANL